MPQDVYSGVAAQVGITAPPPVLIPKHHLESVQQIPRRGQPCGFCHCNWAVRAGFLGEVSKGNGEALEKMGPMSRAPG